MGPAAQKHRLPAGVLEDLNGNIEEFIASEEAATIFESCKKGNVKRSHICKGKEVLEQSEMCCKSAGFAK